jgi:hypothetical protein
LDTVIVKTMLLVLPIAWCFLDYRFITFQVTHYFHIFILDFRSRLCVTQCISFSVSVFFPPTSFYCIVTAERDDCAS